MKNNNSIFRSVFSVVLCGLVLSPMAAADDAKWFTYAEEGRAAFAQDRVNEASKQYKTALTEAEKQKVSEKDPKLEKLLMNDIPDLIERVCQMKDYEKAEELAMAKVAFVEKTFGGNSAFILDGMQDLQLIYAEQKKTDMIAKVLMRYSTTTNTLREQGKIEEADRVVNLRKDRLQRQLKEQFERIQRRFEPATSSNPASESAPATSNNTTESSK